MRRLRRFLSGLVHLTIIFAAAGGLAAKYVSPQYLWWLQLLGVVLPVLGFLVIVGTLWTLLGRRYSFLAAYAVVLLLIGVRFVDMPGGSNPATGATELTIMSANLPRFWPSDQSDKLVSLARKESPDVVCLQESALKRRRNGSLTGAEHALALAGPGAYHTAIPPGKEYRAPVLSRMEQVSFVEEDFGDAEDGSTNSTVSTTVLNVEGRELVIYNVHLRSYGNDKPWGEGWLWFLRPGALAKYADQYRVAFAQRAEHAQILAQRLQAETRPFILAGDLNATPHNHTYRVLSNGLTDAFGARGKGWGATYHADFPFARIDFLFGGPGVDFSHAKVIDVDFSDHRTVVGSLRF